MSVPVPVSAYAKLNDTFCDIIASVNKTMTMRTTTGFVETLSIFQEIFQVTIYILFLHFLDLVMKMA
jgi:hypothetical protein